MVWSPAWGPRNDAAALVVNQFHRQFSYTNGRSESSGGAQTRLRGLSEPSWSFTDQRRRPGDGLGYMALRHDTDGRAGWLGLGVGAFDSNGAIINVGLRRADVPPGVIAHAGDCDAILPVELVSFTATAVERGIQGRTSSPHVE